VIVKLAVVPPPPGNQSAYGQPPLGATAPGVSQPTITTAPDEGTEFTSTVTVALSPTGTELTERLRWMGIVLESTGLAAASADAATRDMVATGSPTTTSAANTRAAAPMPDRTPRNAYVPFI